MAQEWSPKDVEWLVAEGLRLADESQRTNALPQNRARVSSWLKQVDSWANAGLSAQHRAEIDRASDTQRGFFVTGQYTSMQGDAFIKDIRATVEAIRESAKDFNFPPEPLQSATSTEQYPAQVPVAGSLEPASLSSELSGGLGLSAGLAMPLGGVTAHHTMQESAAKDHQAEPQEREEESARVWRTWNEQKNATENESEKARPSSLPATPCRLTTTTHPDERNNCLRVDDYAHALADVMNAASGEFCFAVYGHWGRGKTFFMEQVAARLPDHYKTIWFSAWKYRTKPEIWVHLYETVARAARKDGVCSAVPRSIRAYTNRHGMWPVIVLLSGLALAILGLGVVPVLVGLLGIIGLPKAYAVVRWVTRVPPDMFTLPQHKAKLGLQAAIGDDLVALLRGWIPTKRGGEGASSGLPHAGWLIPYFLSIFLVVGALFVTLHGSLTQVWTCGLQLGCVSRPYAALAVGIVGILVPVWIARGGTQTQRLAFIVDDLDRCEPATMLELIESLKLLMEDPDVRARVQVIMLVEEEALHYAIRQRYLHLITDYSGPAASPARPDGLGPANLERATAITLDTVEKLFVAHLRLPRLQAFELKDVMRSYLDQPALLAQLTSEEAEQLRRRQEGEQLTYRRTAKLEGEPQGVSRPSTHSDGPSDASQKRTTRVVVDGLRVGLRSDPAGDVNRPRNATTNDLAGLVFSHEERTQLGEAAELLFDAAKGRALGPRALRTFIMRYQLAKFLLAKRNASCAPRELVLALVNGPNSTLDEHVNAVIAQVL